MEITITWEQFMDMNSPAAGIGTINALFEEMETTLHNGGRVNILDVFGNPSKIINTMEEYLRWKDGLEVEEEVIEEEEFVELEFEDVKPDDLIFEDDEFEIQ